MYKTKVYPKIELSEKLNKNACSTIDLSARRSAQTGIKMKKLSGKKSFVFLFILAAIGVLSACMYDDTEADWGSFTPDKTYSYDEAYYALQSVERTGPQDMIKVSVYSKNSDELIAEFSPARASDFWGICWESDTYNIWIQSGDIGVLCYTFQDGKWTLDRYAQRPNDIISKYD